MNTFTTTWKAIEKQISNDKNITQVKGNPINIYKAIIGGLSYNNTLRCKVTKAGLYINLVWPFSLSHRPVIIPWDAFRSVEDHKAVLGSYKRIKVGQPEITTIDLDEKRFNLLKKHLRERSRLNV